MQKSQNLNFQILVDIFADIIFGIYNVPHLIG